MEGRSIDRRTFVGAMCALGAASAVGVHAGAVPQVAVAANSEFPAPARGNPVEAKVDPKTGEVTVNEDVIVRYSTCLGCFSTCGNRLKMPRSADRIYSLGGNPYHPSSAYPYLQFDAPLDDAFRSMSYADGAGNLLRGTVCGRGNASIDGYSQPDRVTTPLKRAGKRGEGKWKAISWDQLIEEVVEGGKIFADLGEDVEVEGFRALYDPETPMDPDKPGLGPISNQVVVLGGRGDGRGNVNARFLKVFGTVNQHGHGSSCGGAYNVSSLVRKNGADASIDVEDCEYALWLGTFPGANGKSFQSIAKRCSANVGSGHAKMDIFDPCLGNGCVTPGQPGFTWHPIRSATNGALVLGMLQWMFENDAHNTEYLSFPSYKAAVAGGYASNTDATHLVIVDEGHAHYGKYLLASEAGLEEPAAEASTSSSSSSTTTTYYVVIDAETGQPAVHSECAKAQVEFEGEVNGIQVRSAFMFLKDGAYEHTMQEYSDICGVPVETIESVAREFTSHGVKAAAFALGGTASANGMCTQTAWDMLNAMIGNNQMVGGLMGRRRTAKTTVDGERYKLATVKNPGVTTSNAIYISRTNCSWEKTDEYKNRVAAGEKDPMPKLPWFGFNVASDNQALAGIVNQYPYQCKILISWMTDTLQASPGFMRDATVKRLCDTSVLPLHIACDVVVGEHASLADYIVPDTIPMESWGVVTQEGHWKGRGNAVRWPAKNPETIEISGGRHAHYEAFLCDVAEAIGMPGFGEDAIEATDGTLYPLHDAADYFLKGVVNLAWDTEVVEDVSDEDIQTQALDELPELWKRAVSDEEWPKVLRVLSRGGRFWDVAASTAKDGKTSAYKQENTYYIYGEKKASLGNGIYDKKFNGALHWEPERLIDGTPLHEAYPMDEWPFTSTNYKPKFRSISMLSNSPIMRSLCTENYLEINLDDAEGLGIHDGDTVRITNPTGDVMEGPAMVRAGIAPSTFGVAYGYGHIGYGAQPIHIEDGYQTDGSEAIGAGVHLQTMLDPTLGDDVIYALSCPESAVPARSGGAYKIEKA